MKEQRFKVGDKVTYKSRKDCNGYCYGGSDMVGYVGDILRYESFNDHEESWEILVTTHFQDAYYSMLEREFEEYDKPKTVDLFPIY